MFEGYDKKLEEWNVIQREKENGISFENYIEKIDFFKKEMISLYGEKTLFEFFVNVSYIKQDGKYEWLEGIGAIDVFIVPIIKKLNELGYTTKYSCSGIRSEHKKYVKDGFISFKFEEGDINNILKVAAFKSGLYVEINEQIINDKRRVTLIVRNEQKYDWLTKMKWKRFIKIVEKMSNKVKK